MFYSRHPFIFNYLSLKWNDCDIIDQRMRNKRLSEVIYTKLIHVYPKASCTCPDFECKTSNISFGVTWGWLVHRTHVTIFISGLWTPLSKKDSRVCTVALAVTVISWAGHGLLLQAPITVLFLKNIETCTLCAHRDEDATRRTRRVMGTSSHPVFWASVTTPQLRLHGGTNVKTSFRCPNLQSDNNTAQFQRKKAVENCKGCLVKEKEMETG